MATGLRGTIAATKQDLDGLFAELDKYHDAASRLQQVLDGVGTSARLAAGEVRGVFLGVDISVQGRHDRGVGAGLPSDAYMGDGGRAALGLGD